MSAAGHGAAPVRLLVVSDVTTDNLGTLFRKEPSVAITPVLTPLGAVHQSLLAPPEADAAFVWTRPEAASVAFTRLLAQESVTLAELRADVDAFADLVIRAQQSIPTMLVASWTSPWYRRGLGMLDLKAESGVARALLTMNARLVERLADAPGVFVLDAQRWAQAIGPSGDSPQGWYLGRLPFSGARLKAAVADVAAALRGIRGGARKLIVVDLDDTLWGGIVGDTGWQGLRLGGHDPVGEAHRDFQFALKALSRRGILLAIASKNDDAVAVDAIRSHPEMVLREADFAARRISWGDKAAAIRDIATELNLGLQHVVFLDDNPAERGRVRETLPDVLVPEWPADPRQYVAALEQLDVFDAPAITAEDRVRGAMYAAERERDAARSAVGSVAEWLATLDLSITVAPVSGATIARAAQLFNKTNQMNLATRRLSEAELATWAATPGQHLFCVTVADRFGDAGLTGLVGLRLDGATAVLEDFVLSCRVFGRQVEETMMHVAVEAARAAGATTLSATLQRTPKNAPTVEFFASKSGLSSPSADAFIWDCSSPYPLPTHVRLIHDAAAAAGSS